jgi:AbiV family abortive infection protein
MWSDYANAGSTAAVDGLCEKYKGHLSIEQLAEGIEACIENARQLFDDACLLLEAGRWARAMSLFIATMEEVGKVSVLAGMSRIPHSNQALWSDLWRDFRSHEVKGTHAFTQTYPDEARGQPDLLLAAAIEQYQLAPLGERLRQRGTFVDFHAREKRWLRPQEATKEEVVAWLERAAAALGRVERLYHLGLYSVASLRLQNETYGPINDGRPKRSNLQPADVASLHAKALAAHREYFRRLSRRESFHRT